MAPPRRPAVHAAPVTGGEALAGMGGFRAEEGFRLGEGARCESGLKEWLAHPPGDCDWGPCAPSRPQPRWNPVAAGMKITMVVELARSRIASGPGGTEWSGRARALPLRPSDPGPPAGAPLDGIRRTGSGGLRPLGASRPVWVRTPPPGHRSRAVTGCRAACLTVAWRRCSPRAELGNPGCTGDRRVLKRPQTQLLVVRPSTGFTSSGSVPSALSLCHHPLPVGVVPDDAAGSASGAPSSRASAARCATGGRDSLGAWVKSRGSRCRPCTARNPWRGR